jgi:two-component system NarL family sensor kinase
LNNVIKHSGASACDIRLTSDASGIGVELKDNGKGFETKSAKTGIGLQNIQSRVNSLNGTLSIDSIATKGTSVSLRIGITDRSWKTER